MATLRIDESKVEFFYYLQRLFKQIDGGVDPLKKYNKFEIFLIKSTSKRAKVKIYGAFITAE